MIWMIRPVRSGCISVSLQSDLSNMKKDLKNIKSDMR